MTTALHRVNHSFKMTNEGGIQPTYTRDTWLIPKNGTEVWCTAWKRSKPIKPYEDGCHIRVGLTVYHCAEFMAILTRLEKDGHSWGIVDVLPTREQQIGGINLNDWNPRRNASGYSDPTAYEAMKNENKEEIRVRRLLRTIFDICALAGFKVDGRIVLVDKVNGRVWR